MSVCSNGCHISTHAAEKAFMGSSLSGFTYKFHLTFHVIYPYGGINAKLISIYQWKNYVTGYIVDRNI